MADIDVLAYGGRRNKVHAAIEAWQKQHPKEYGFPVKYGLALHKLDVEWYSHNIKDATKRKEFVAAARKLITGKKFKNGMDVPRGVDVEHLYYKIDKGYTDKQYADYLQSLD
jgi:hypothetical protein